MAPERTILDGATVVTMDGARTEHATGHVVIENGRIAAVGAGARRRSWAARASTSPAAWSRRGW